MADVPRQYQPDDRQWATKEWLYEHYWGAQLSVRELRDKAQKIDGESVSGTTVKREMAKRGVPRRPVPDKSTNDSKDNTQSDECVDWSDLMSD